MVRGMVRGCYACHAYGGTLGGTQDKAGMRKDIVRMRKDAYGFWDVTQNQQPYNPYI